MENVINSFVLTSVLLLAFIAQAAHAAELAVRGVITPQACTPSLDGNGVVAFGDIPAHSLKPGQYTRLPERQINLTISCTNAIRVGIRFTDNRHSSMVSGIAKAVSQGNVGDTYNFGLGSVDGKNVGGYLLSLSSDVKADGKRAINISSADGTSWRPGDGHLHNNGVDYVSFGDDGNRPVPVKQLALKIDVKAILNKPENLSLNYDVPLDGSATIEVVYL